MVVRAVWLPMAHIYNVRGTQHPGRPTVGMVTHSEAKDYAEQPELA